MADDRADHVHGVDRTEHASALPIGTRIGRYRIEAVLGQGAFGITYRAHDLQLERAVAVKEYLPALLATRLDGLTVLPRSTQVADDFAWGRAQFLDEAQTLARLAHAQRSSRCTTISKPTARPTWSCSWWRANLGQPMAARQGACRSRPSSALSIRCSMACNRFTLGRASSRHQAGQHHRGGRRLADLDRLRRVTGRDGRPDVRL